MPTIFTEDGFRFFFYSNDHEPIHVHVRKGGAEAVFHMTPELRLRESVGFKLQELNRAQELAESRQEAIIRAWNEHLG